MAVDLTEAQRQKVRLYLGYGRGRDIHPRLESRFEGFLSAEEADEIAARVLATGKTIKLDPMNSYQRRLIHHHFEDHPSVRTWSPEDKARLKRISLSPRNQAL